MWLEICLILKQNQNNLLIKKMVEILTVLRKEA